MRRTCAFNGNGAGKCLHYGNRSQNLVSSTAKKKGMSAKRTVGARIRKDWGTSQEGLHKRETTWSRRGCGGFCEGNGRAAVQENKHFCSAIFGPSSNTRLQIDEKNDVGPVGGREGLKRYLKADT